MTALAYSSFKQDDIVVFDPPEFDFRVKSGGFDRERVADGQNWYVYCSNNPINMIDPTGLEDIVIFSAIDRWNNKNNIGYNALVHDSYRKIRKTAKAEGLTVRIVKGSDATADRLFAELQDSDTKRLIVVAHGDSRGTFYDVDGEKIKIGDYSGTTGSNLQTVDLVGCYGNEGVSDWAGETGVGDVRSYNPTDEAIWWNQTNEALDTKIPESIETGVNNTGPPTVEPEPITNSLFGSGREGTEGTDELKNS